MRVVPDIAHVVLFPYDEHGHVTPVFALGCALASRGIRVTGVLTASRFSTYTASSYKLSTPGAADETSCGLFHVVAIPDSTHEAGNHDAEDVCYQQSLQKLEPGFEELMLRLQPPPTCLISDALYPWSQDLADRLGIPRLHSWGFCAVVPLLLLYTPALYARGLLPFRPEMAEELLDFVPGLPVNFRLGDVPVDFLSRDAKQLEFLFLIAKGMKQAAGIVLNTVDELEPEAVQALAKELPGVTVYTLGSMSSLQDMAAAAAAAGHCNGSSNGVNGSLSSINGVKEECLQWLDGQPRASVVYVALGSMVCLTEEEIRGLALGLEASGQPFLWVLRRGAVEEQRISSLRQDDPLSVLPEGFLQRNCERGRVIAWAPQTAVLAHASVGCFITHCGNGSFLEALCVGMPMIGGFCKIAEQNTNLRLLSQEWGVAIPLLKQQQLLCSSGRPTEDHYILKRCVESCVKEVLHEGKGRALSRNAFKLKAILSKAMQAPHGSSHVNLAKLEHAINYPVQECKTALPELIKRVEECTLLHRDHKLIINFPN